MIRKIRLTGVSVLVACVVALSLVGIAYAAWVYIATIYGSAQYTPNQAKFYGKIEYPSSSIRRIRAHNGQVWWSQDRINYICGEAWKGNRTAFSFDNKGLNGGPAHGLDALHWVGTSLPNPDLWRNDDNGDGLAEEIKISVQNGCQLVPGQNYYVQVVFEDKAWDGVHDYTKTDGEINDSGYWVKWRARITSEWWCQFDFFKDDRLVKGGCNF